MLVNDFAYRAWRDRALVIFEGHFRRFFARKGRRARVTPCVGKISTAMKGRGLQMWASEEANLTKRELCERIKKHFPEFTYIEAAIRKDPDQRDYVVSNQRIISTGFETK